MSRGQGPAAAGPQRQLRQRAYPRGRSALRVWLAFAPLALLLSVAGAAQAAAPPTGDPGVSVAAAPLGVVAGSVDGGGTHACGVVRNGTVACWGQDTYDQATPPPGTFKAVSAALFHTCGIETDGTVTCWGRNGNRQASPLAGTFTAISSGGFHTCGIRTAGTLACWGSPHFGKTSAPPGHLHRP